MMTIVELYQQTQMAYENYWFLQNIIVYDRTESTITLHLIIKNDLYVQIFLSERSQRLSFALIGPSGRLYGLDCEHGYWHRHPFGAIEKHIPISEGLSIQPVMQFLSEVEDILIESDLI